MPTDLFLQLLYRESTICNNPINVYAPTEETEDKSGSAYFILQNDQKMDSGS